MPATTTRTRALLSHPHICPTSQGPFLRDTFPDFLCLLDHTHTDRISASLVSPARMCHLNIVHYLFCGHWRYDTAHCGFRRHVLCVKKTTDGTIHDVCPQCRIFSTPKCLKEVRRCNRQFCEYLRFTKEASVADGPRDSRSGKLPTGVTRKQLQGAKILTDTCVDRQRQYSGAEWKAYCPPDGSRPETTAPCRAAGTIKERLNPTNKRSEDGRS